MIKSSSSRKCFTILKRIALLCLKTKNNEANAGRRPESRKNCLKAVEHGQNNLQWLTCKAGFASSSFFFTSFTLSTIETSSSVSSSDDSSTFFYTHPNGFSKKGNK